MKKCNTPLVSVIICVYNGDKYLCRCIQSVVSQSYQDLEIIIVDDGSTDNTFAIIEEYAMSDSRICVVRKVNEGLSLARKTGIEQAHGKYVQYLDSDDSLQSNAIEILVDTGERAQADIVVFPFFFCEGDNRRKSLFVDLEQMAGVEYMKLILNSKAYWTVWSKFHLRSLYSENVEFINISFGEDVVLSTQLLIHSAKVVAVNIPLLDYYVYLSSISHDLNEKAYCDFDYYVRWFDNYLNQLGLNEKLAKELALFHVRNTQARIHWKKVKDIDNEMGRMVVELQAYPELQELLRPREKRIVATYKRSRLLGYWRLYYYCWKNKL